MKLSEITKKIRSRFEEISKKDRFYLLVTFMAIDKIKNYTKKVEIPIFL
jgi:hypothetical protein